MSDVVIKKIRKVVLRPIETAEDVLELLTLFQTHFESKDIQYQQKYLLLWLFSDWRHGDNLGSSFPALMFLKQFNERLESIAHITDNKIFIDELREIISFEKVRDELSEFLKEHSIPSDLTQFPYSWKQFIGHVADILLHKPLAFPDPTYTKLKHVYNEQTLNQIRKRQGAISFTITKYDRAILEGKSDRLDDKVVCLVILTHDATKIVVPL